MNNEFWSSFLKDIEKDNFFHDQKQYSSDNIETDSASAYSNSLSPQSASSGYENADQCFTVDPMDTCDYTTINVPKLSSTALLQYDNVSTVDSLSTNIDIGIFYAIF